MPLRERGYCPQGSEGEPGIWQRKSLFERRVGNHWKNQAEIKDRDTNIAKIKDVWTWTTVWWLPGGRGYKGAKWYWKKYNKDSILKTVQKYLMEKCKSALVLVFDSINDLQVHIRSVKDPLETPSQNQSKKCKEVK